MTQDIKWHLRQMALTYLSFVLSPTAWIVYIVTIKAWKFSGYAGQLYHKDFVKTGASLGQIIQHWYSMEIGQYLYWIPVALAIDVVVRRFYLKFD